MNRWEYERHVCASTLPALTRLVLFVLAQSSDANTLAIPDRYTPSLAKLAARTGMKETAVRTHLRAAADAGWLQWSRGGARGRGDRSSYVLTVPERVRETNPSGPERVRETNPSGPERVRETNPLISKTPDLKTSDQPSGVARLVRSVFPDATDDEIETITKKRQARGARSVAAVLRHEIADRSLRLPCSTHGEGRHSTECRCGDGADCSRDWCTCRCHIKPKETP